MKGEVVYESLLGRRILSWDQVFDIWRNNEEHLPHWQEVWTGAGFDSWADWRMGTVRDLRLADRGWVMYEIQNPASVIPRFSYGLYKEWRIRPLDYWTSFDLARLINPQVTDNKYIQEMKENFPPETTLIGLCDPVGDKMYIVDGTQRCFAYTWATTAHDPPPTRVNIAVAYISDQELRYLLGMTPRGKVLKLARKIRKRILGK